MSTTHKQRGKSSGAKYQPWRWLIFTLNYGRPAGVWRRGWPKWRQDMLNRQKAKLIAAR